MSDNKKTKKLQGIQSVENAFHILETIKTHSNFLTLSKISQLTGMSMSNVQKYITSFLKLDIVIQNNHTYSLGPKILDLGLYSLNSHAIVEIADSYLKEIQQRTQKTTALNIWTSTGPVVMKSELSQAPISVSIQPGYRPPLYKSATGKCFLAFMDFNKNNSYIKNKKELQFNLNKYFIEDEIEEIKKLGYSYRNTTYEGIPGGTAITCPVFDEAGIIIAAISIIGLTKNMNIIEDSEEVKILKEISSNLSCELSSYQKNK